MSLLQGNADLTSQEWAITALIAQGRTNAEIAAEIHTGEQLVEGCLRKILEKTGCWNRTEVALWYLKVGVERERRSRDRREAESQVREDRRKSGRRHPLEPSPRAHEQHELNLEE
jgi:DNA-binding CsgD family transcriptional regulator